MDDEALPWDRAAGGDHERCRAVAQVAGVCNLVGASMIKILRALVSLELRCTVVRVIVYVRQGPEVPMNCVPQHSLEPRGCAGGQTEGLRQLERWVVARDYFILFWKWRRMRLEAPLPARCLPAWRLMDQTVVCVQYKCPDPANLHSFGTSFHVIAVEQVRICLIYASKFAFSL